MIKHLLILAVPLLSAACVTDRGADTLTGSAAEGRAFAAAHCAGCHALEGGESPNPDAPSLRRAAHQLPAPMMAGSLRTGIQIGHTAEMPIFVFEDENIDKLLAYFEVLRADD